LFAQESGANAQRVAANEALEAHDFPRALKLLAPLAAASPKDALLLYDLGSAQDALDQAGPATQSYRAAITDDPALLAPRVALGLLLARGGQLEEARTEFLEAVKVETKGQPADNLLKARAYRALARIDQKPRPADARDELLEALKLSPETPEDTLLAAELAAASSDGAPAAEAQYRRLLAARPNDAAATAALAHLLILQKRQPEAETLLKAAVAANPGDPALTTQLATLYTGQGKFADAVPLLEGLHAANPRDMDVAHFLTNLYLQQRNYAQAEPILAQLALARPTDMSIMADRADALIHLKRYAEAEALLTRAVAQPTRFETPAALGNAAGALAFAASENNDPAEALRALTLRATVLPPSPPMLFLAAISEDKLNHVKLAVQAYKDFLAASNGTLPDQEFEAQHRLVALEHRK
jgi:predicted Zn-dependent protease